MYSFKHRIIKTGSNNKPIILFTGVFILLLSLIKIGFYYYNKPLLFNHELSTNELFGMAKWSFVTDTAIILCLNFGFLIAMQFLRFSKNAIFSFGLLIVFTLLNSFVLVLNIADIFYFRFNHQRASSDLLYVLDNPLFKLKHINFLSLVAFILLFCLILFVVFKMNRWLIGQFKKGKTNKEFLLVCCFAFLSLFFFRTKVRPFLLPAYPLVALTNSSLTVSQNSFHTFIYSILTGGEKIPSNNFIGSSKNHVDFPIRVLTTPAAKEKRNIVLFLMESIPLDFFDSSNKYFTQLPFFSALLQKSSFYNNAFCYSQQSNKGITAVLGSVPTLTDIPLYHSSYINLPITKMGAVLKQQGYQSFFCIGDGYDNFGFAKCTNWLGFDKYYSKEDIPGYKNLPSQAMGVHDEYVLDFMQKKIAGLSEPFLAANFNISTHYDYELPKNFNRQFPASYTTAMKSMVYYDYCLGKFFESAQKEKWYSNTVFIFCSDHWMFPDEKNVSRNTVTDFKIPIIIFDPKNEQKKLIQAVVTQFDILPTVLSLSGYDKSIITYGHNLLDSTANGSKVAFSKIDNNIYQITDSAYALGFNVTTNATAYLFHYTIDGGLKKNLRNDPLEKTRQAELEEKINGILQKALLQYGNKPFN